MEEQELTDTSIIEEPRSCDLVEEYRSKRSIGKGRFGFWTPPPAQHLISGGGLNFSGVTASRVGQKGSLKSKDKERYRRYMYKSMKERLETRGRVVCIRTNEAFEGTR